MPVAGLPELTLHMGGATLAIEGAALRSKTGFAPGSTCGRALICCC